MEELFYLDDDNNIVESDKATHMVLREVDENGVLVKETFSSHKKKKKNDEEEYEITPEMQKVLDEFKKNFNKNEQ